MATSIPWTQVHTTQRKSSDNGDRIKQWQDVASSVAKQQQKQRVPAPTDKVVAVPWNLPSSQPRAELTENECDDSTLHWGTVLLLLALAITLVVAVGCVGGMCVHSMRRRFA